MMPVFSFQFSAPDGGMRQAFPPYVFLQYYYQEKARGWKPRLSKVETSVKAMENRRTRLHGVGEGDHGPPARL